MIIFVGGNMSEKQVIVTLEDGFGRVQTSIATSLSAPQLMDKIIEIDEQQALIEDKSNVIILMGAFIKSKGFSVDDFDEWISEDWHIGDEKYKLGE